MARFALLVILEAKSGKEKEVESFLKSALPLVENEPGTKAWFALKLASNRFGIFDVFSDETGRQAHLEGKVAAALMSKAQDLFSKPFDIQKIDLLADKMPEASRPFSDLPPEAFAP